MAEAGGVVKGTLRDIWQLEFFLLIKIHMSCLIKTQ
jgi:hypothetical protein